MKIRLEDGDFGTYLLVAEDGRDVLIQTDWDYPGTASSFGWQPCCGSGATDGTVDCPDCGANVSDMIASAYQYLDDHIGDEIEDPGYFEPRIEPDNTPEKDEFDFDSESIMGEAVGGPVPMSQAKKRWASYTHSVLSREARRAFKTQGERWAMADGYPYVFTPDGQWAFHFSGDGQGHIWATAGLHSRTAKAELLALLGQGVDKLVGESTGRVERMVDKQLDEEKGMPLSEGRHVTTDAQGRQWKQNTCSCGYKGPRHIVGKRMKYVFATPTLCPRCGKEISSSSVVY